MDNFGYERDSDDESSHSHYSHSSGDGVPQLDSLLSNPYRCVMVDYILYIFYFVYYFSDDPVCTSRAQSESCEKVASQKRHNSVYQCILSGLGWFLSNCLWWDSFARNKQNLRLFKMSRIVRLQLLPAFSQIKTAFHMFSQCEHGDLGRERRPWIAPASLAMTKLRRAICGDDYKGWLEIHDG